MISMGRTTIHRYIMLQLLAILAAALLLAVGILLYRTGRLSGSSYRPPEGHDTIQAEDVVMAYQALETELIDAVDYYIESYTAWVDRESPLDARFLVKSCILYDVDVRMVLAQARVESNLGVSGMAVKTNNIWNVGVYDGKTHREIHDGYKFKTPALALLAYLDLLKRRYLVTKSELEVMTDFVDVDGRRYATAQNYELQLMSIYIDMCKHTDLGILWLETRDLYQHMQMVLEHPEKHVGKSK